MTEFCLQCRTAFATPLADDLCDRCATEHETYVLMPVTPSTPRGTRVRVAEDSPRYAGMEGTVDRIDSRGVTFLRPLVPDGLLYAVATRFVAAIVPCLVRWD